MSIAMLLGTILENKKKDKSCATLFHHRWLLDFKLDLELVFDPVLDPPLPLGFTVRSVRSEDRVRLVDTWLMLSLGLTTSSNLLECRDAWEVVLEWLERCE